jgi:ABC-type transporter MlaC component
VQGLEIATVEHISLIPVQRKLYTFGALGPYVRTASNSAKVAFFAAFRLAMSGSIHTPHGHKVWIC